MKVGIGAEAARFLFWDICFKFSVLCLCSERVDSEQNVKTIYLSPSSSLACGLANPGLT
jgi:hypothetical protein